MATEFTPETVKGWLALSPFIACMRLELVSVDAQESVFPVKLPMPLEFKRGALIGGRGLSLGRML